MRQKGGDLMHITMINREVLSEPVSVYDVVLATPYNNFLIKTNDSYIVSHNCGLM